MLYSIPACDICMFAVKVKCSQRMNIASLLLKPSAGIRPDGTIIYTHYNCIVGANEVCSRIAAMLWLGSESVTQLLLRPSTIFPVA